MSLEKYCILGNRHVSILPASIRSAILQVVCICNFFYCECKRLKLEVKRLEILKNHTLSRGTYLPSPSIYGIIPPPPEDFMRHVASKHGFGRRILDYSWIFCCQMLLFFCCLNIFEFKHDSYIFGDMPQQVSCLS